MLGFWEKVNKKGPNGCWVWTACTDGKGYGTFHVPGTKSKVKKAYRISYEIMKGVIPEGNDIDHLCRNKICVNPKHLEAVPHKENVMRGESFMAKKARQTRCIHGHEYTFDNTLYHHGRRTCRECRRTQKARESCKLRMRKHRAKKKRDQLSPLTT